MTTEEKTKLLPNGAFPHALPKGTKIKGHYCIRGVLGAGGFGITYLAYDENLKQLRAIKECFPSKYAYRPEGSYRVEPLPDEEEKYERLQRMFLSEGQSLAKLSHGGIVKVHALEQENNTYYMVMDYLDGQTLNKYMEVHGRISPEDTIDITKKVLYALKKVHEEGLVHRDIAPDNIMMMPDAKPVLLDFGSVISVNKTKVTLALGKDGYTPFEMYKADGIPTAAVDIYSLSATMYKMMTGISPSAAIDRFGDPEKLVPPSKVDPPIEEMTEEIERIILKGMEMEAEDRYQSADEMLAAIEAVEDKKPVAYRIEYYYDGLYDHTETLFAPSGTVIEQYQTKPRSGYQLEKADGLPLAVSADGDNVIRVHYIKQTIIWEAKMEAQLQADLKKASGNHASNAEVGDTIEYTVVLCNTGDVELNVQGIRFDGITGENGQTILLRPAQEGSVKAKEKRTYAQHYRVKEEDAGKGQINCRVTVDCQSVIKPLKAQAENTVICERTRSAPLPRPQVFVYLTAMLLEKADGNTGSQPEAGDLVDVCYVVKHTGSAPLAKAVCEVYVSSNLLSTTPKSNLLPSREWTAHQTYIVDEKDSNGNVITFWAAVTGETTDGIECGAEDRTSINIQPKENPIRKRIIPAIVAVLVIGALALLLMPKTPHMEYSGAEFRYYRASNDYVSLGTSLSIDQMNDHTRVYFVCTNPSSTSYQISSIRIECEGQCIAESTTPLVIQPGSSEVFSCSVQGSGTYRLFVNDEEVASTWLSVKASSLTAK